MAQLYGNACWVYEFVFLNKISLYFFSLELEPAILYLFSLKLSFIALTYMKI
jgi:hypothetical protein